MECIIYITYSTPFQRLVDGDIELSSASHTDEEVFDGSHFHEME